MRIDHHDTIVAPITPPGEGGVGIVRLSGSQAEELLRRLFRPHRPVAHFTSHRLYYGTAVGAGGEALDEILAVVMRAPRSYTREDVAELHCHGGPLVLRRILDGCMAAGARLARPGEFTLRAFLNGRLDLAQAEGVIDLIRARSEDAGRLALQQVQGRLSRSLLEFRVGLVDLLALVEAHIDFPEEELQLPVSSRLHSQAEGILARMDALLATFDAGRVLREGIAILLLGRPNVGKSSLLNALLDEDRAIVTSIPGTTRDTIEEKLVIGGLAVRLIDTAGIRATHDPIEIEGVRRAREKVLSADLVLLVVDGSGPMEEDDLLALAACAEAPTLVVINKADLDEAPLSGTFQGLPQVRVSARTGGGVDALRSRIVSHFQQPSAEAREDFLLNDRRHRQALLRSREALASFIQGSEAGEAMELLAIELREALDGLGEITGETTPDQVLDQIFSRFCIGK